MRRKNVLRLSSVVLGAALLAAACGSDKKESGGATTTATGGTATTAAGGGTAKCTGLTVASFQALTGEAAGLGEPIRNGAELAVKQFNEKNKDCQIKFQAEDSQGDPAQAPALAKKLVDQKDVIGVVGPSFSGESKNAGPAFNEAGLTTISPSATNPALSTNGWKTFHRLLANDDVQGPGIATYIKNTMKPTKVAVIDDASTYGKGLGDIVRSSLGSVVTVNDVIDPKGSDYSAAVTKVKDGGVDVVMFGGYYEAAGRLAKQLKDAGVTAKFIAGDGVKDSGFMTAGGTATEGAIITCTCAPPESLPKGADFVTAYKAAYGIDPGTYAAEAYDSAGFLLAGIAAGNQDRAKLQEYVSSQTYPGITKDVKFDDTGEVTAKAVYAFVVKDGKIVGEGEIK